MMGGWGGMGWLHSILMIAFWVLVIVGLVFIVKWLIQASRGERSGTEGGSKAVNILKERYAKGEINHEEFERMRRDLLT
jgi:putative membrane protein